MKYFNRLYLDKEKDIQLDFYKNKDNYSYILRTPNHKSGNLITNLAKICHLEISFDNNGLKIIKGDIPSYINEQNERIHILRFDGKAVAVIDNDGKIHDRVSIPAISKTLMSQTKDIKLNRDDVLVRNFIEEKYKFLTDVHSHMNANLYPDILIALGIYHQIRYPYYYVKKLNLKLTDKQKDYLEKQRLKSIKRFKDLDLKGKKRDRKIDDHTYINFADLILNNIKDSSYNIDKIRISLCILKDGQAVFTNLEKLYLYRYVFTKGKAHQKKISLKNINKIEDEDIRNYLNRMLLDSLNPDYKDNSLFEDKLLWISRMYQRSGVKYVELSNTTLVKADNSPLELLKQAHYILPLAEKETGVKIRFLAAIRRIPLTIVKDNVTPENYLRENLDVLKVLARDPYVVGSDIVGEEINDIAELKPVIKELVDIAKKDKYFTLRIHAGENDSLVDNVKNALDCVKDSLNKNQRMPKLRLGHGVYTPNLKSKKGKQLIKDLIDNNVILEFQLTSNVRLNNINKIENHPIKEYLKYGVKTIQGSDGPGVYGTDSMDEELALLSLLKLNKDDLLKIKDVENEIIKDADKSFKEKTRKFNKYLNGRDLKEVFKKEIEENRATSDKIVLNIKDKYLSKNVLNNIINSLPIDKYPIVLAGGSFSSENKNIKLLDSEKKMIEKLLSSLNPNKVYFVVGHKLNAYEKYLIYNKKDFEVVSIVPSYISEFEKNKLNKSKLATRISIESLGMGIYKSFNYEIFERRSSCVVAIEGNSAAENLIQEAKNGKAKALIYVSNNSIILKQKAQTLEGYVTIYKDNKDIDKMINKIVKESKKKSSL